MLGECTSDDLLLIIKSYGMIRTLIPEMTLHIEDNIVVLEKWEPEKPISIIYWDGERELFYVKRFLVDNPDREEKIITDHAKSYLEIVFTDYRPLAEVVFVKDRNTDRKEQIGRAHV